MRAFSSLVPRIKETNHRVFFQNAERNINLGVFFNAPDVEMNELFWYNILAGNMFDSFRKNEGLISVDDESTTQSCYVELHRKS